MIELLKKFCHDDATRTSIATPWSAGEHSFATNGHMIVRVSRLADVPEREDAPFLGKMFPYADPAEWFALADIKLPKPKTVDCSGCDGDGEIEHEECADCSGHKCEECNGTGEVTPLDIPVPVGNTHFQLGYLLTLKDLPNCKIGPGPASPLASLLKEAPFQFDGGDGLLMPINLGGWKEVKS